MHLTIKVVGRSEGNREKIQIINRKRIGCKSDGVGFKKGDMVKR
jgi:hypothetical protein